MNTAHTRPRFRTDLVAQPLDEDGQRFVDVTDPDSGTTFRFYESEYSVACTMDGQRDLNGLAEWAQAELGLSPTPAELQEFIATLEELGYLEDDDAFDLGSSGAAFSEEDEPLPSGLDFELGTAGKSSLEAEQDENLESAELTLGLSGSESLSPGTDETDAGMSADERPTQVKRAGSVFDRPPAPPAEEAEVRAVLRPVTPMGHAPDEDDGPTNLPPPASDFDDEMSVDLTDHMRIGTDDVKEAIRQSQAMQAVDIPAALAAEEAAKAAGQAEADQPEAKQKAPAAPRAQTRPPASPVAATELPDKPAQVSAKEEPGFPAAPQPVAGGSRLPLVLALVVLALVGALAVAYFYVLPRMNAQEAGSATGAVEQPEVPATPEPPPPEPASARMGLADVEPVEVTVTREGRIEEIMESGKEVAEGDVVVKLDGYQSFEPKIAAYENDQRRYEKRIEDTEAKKAEAEAQGNESAVERHQRYIDLHVEKIADKKERADAERKEMEAFFIRAPVAGMLETELEVRADVKVDAVAFRVQPPPVLEATFSLSEETVPAEPPAEGADVELAAKADDSKKAMCQVSQVNGNDVTVTCPADSGLEEGDEVVLL